ncbi:MAG: dockerin type I repeat-containing protein [Muribaculaceae bacterium]|nr:dockerin type I repeat-containing protein [Muribaculaceae bacterium]MBR0025384.1 dockerin type I repeat-containing protein [Muribaculaceae bacterium]
MTHSGQSEQAIKALENNAASIAKQYIINGCYVGSIDRAVAIHVTSVKMSHVAVNQDGNISAVDVSAIYDVMLGISNRFKPWADVNGDGYINAVDITVIYNKLLGL